MVNTRLIQPQVIPFLNRPPLEAICKVVDVSHHLEAESLNAEARAYAALKHLQGVVIPTLYGFYTVWGILRLIALEPVGQAITETETINQQLRQKMRDALYRIHRAGYVHGDVARRNFCRRQDGRIFLVDLERCQCRNQAERDIEMNAVNEL